MTVPESSGCEECALSSLLRIGAQVTASFGLDRADGRELGLPPSTCFLHPSEQSTSCLIITDQVLKERQFEGWLQPALPGLPTCIGLSCRPQAFVPASSLLRHGCIPPKCSAAACASGLHLLCLKAVAKAWPCLLAVWCSLLSVPTPHSSFQDRHLQLSTRERDCLRRCEDRAGERKSTLRANHTT